MRMDLDRCEKLVLMVSLVLVGVPFSWMLSRMIALQCAEKLPQIATGDGVMAVAFGDARETLSRAMMHKADSYFHGGIDIDCHEGEGHLLSNQYEEEHDEGGHCHKEHGEGRNHHSFDPWRWIDSRISAPRIHVHLEKEKSVELMPWLWASVKSDPHNVDAWTTAAYVAERELKDAALVRRILDEASAANPESVAVAVARARFDFKTDNDPVAAKRAFSSACELALRKCNGDLSSLPESEAREYRLAQSYLEHLN